MICDEIVAAARRDNVGSRATVNRIVSGSGRYRVGARRARHRQGSGDGGGIEVLEIDDGNGVASRLVNARGKGEVDRRDTGDGFHGEGIIARAAIDGDFSAVGRDRVIAGAGDDGIRAAQAIDGVISRSRGDHVRR